MTRDELAVLGQVDNLRIADNPGAMPSTHDLDVKRPGPVLGRLTFC